MTTPNSDTDAAQAGRWYPVLPSGDLQAATTIALGFLQGQELALWRASDGSPQAWANRCPHRGMRFTLGRVIDGRLSCAYHGWEYQAGDGRCVAIPAHPTMTVPRAICAKTFPVAEADGMIWVGRQPATDAPPATGAQRIVRTLGIRVPKDFAADALGANGWRQAKPDVFQGEIAGHRAVVFLTLASDSLVLLHAGTLDLPSPAQLPTLHAALRRLRDGLEAQWAARGEVQA